MNNSCYQETINRARSEILRNPGSTSLWESVAIVQRANKYQFDPHQKSFTGTDKMSNPSDRIVVVSEEENLEEEDKGAFILVEKCLEHHRSEDFTGLEDSLNTLKLIAPDNPWTLALLGLLYTHKKMYSASKSFLNQAINNEPSNSWFRLWICENSIHERDFQVIIEHGPLISIINGNKRMAFVGLVSIALKIIVNHQDIAPPNLISVYKEILLDLAKGNLSTARLAYSFIIQGIQSRLYSRATSPNASLEILNNLHEINSRVTILLET